MTKEDKLKIYFDTSVPGAYYDVRQTERQALTQYFWQKLPKYDVYISLLTLTELGDTEDQKLREKYRELIKDFKVLPSDLQEVQNLSREYLQAEIIPANQQEDAVHIATATWHHLDVVVSWNFKHMVNPETITRINELNIKLGQRSITILDPRTM